MRQVPSSTITHVSAIPLCHHRRSDFPSPVGDPGCAPEAFPYPRKLKRSPAFPPLRYGESCFARQDRESLSLLRVFPFEGPPPGDLGPYPAMISRGTCSFLTKRPRPHLTQHRFGSPDYPCLATSTGRHISGLQSSPQLQAPRLARPPDCSLRFFPSAAAPSSSRIARLVTCPKMGYRYMCALSNSHGWTSTSWIAAFSAAPLCLAR